MRSYRLAILLLIAACKASTPASSTSEYSEDLSIHRPQNQPPENPEIVNSTKSSAQEYFPLTGHIKNELDSIGRLSYEQNKSGRYVDGFIIQTYSGTSRQEANDILTKMTELFPNLNAKISYRQPSFRVKGGKFIDRLEANRKYNDVKKEFPRALLIPERLLITYE